MIKKSIKQVFLMLKETIVKVTAPETNLKIIDVLSGLRELTKQEISHRKLDLLNLYQNNKILQKSVLKAMLKQHNIIHGSYCIIDKKNGKDYFVSEITVES